MVFSFIHLFLLVWFLIFSSGIKFLTIFINFDIHVCHGHLLEANVFVLLTRPHISLSTVDLEQHRFELCRPTYMQFYLSTTFPHGPVAESADRTALEAEGPL